MNICGTTSPDLEKQFEKVLGECGQYEALTCFAVEKRRKNTILWSISLVKPTVSHHLLAYQLFKSREQFECLVGLE